MRQETNGIPLYMVSCLRSLLKSREEITLYLTSHKLPNR